MKHLREFCFGRLTAIAAAAVVLPMAIAVNAQALVLSDFNDGTTQGWTVDGAAGAGVTITPDTEHGGSLRIDTTTGGFKFGAMRYDQGAVNPHHPGWLPPNTKLRFDVRAGTFTDFMSIRPSYIPSGPAGAGGTVDGPDTNIHTPPVWKTVTWDYPDPPSAQQVPPVPPFWIEWYSINSNGPMTLWIDNIRTVVPEPASLGLLGMGGLGLLGFRRKRA
jgi:hypothetical protein